MNNRVFLDSSILIEYTKNSRPELFEALLGDERFDLYFGSPVISEYLFHFLAIEQWQSLDEELPDVEMPEEEILTELREVRYGKASKN